MPNTDLVVAAQRAGFTGLLDISVSGETTVAQQPVADDRGHCWIRPSAMPDVAWIDELPDSVTTVVVVIGSNEFDDGVRQTIGRWNESRLDVVAQVTSYGDARSAIAAGADGLLASGCEASGRVGDTEAFILLQQCLRLNVPVWARGGIGLHTAAAAIAGGATGVVIDSQLALTSESTLGWATRRAIAAMDGSETRVIGGHRVYTRPDLDVASLDPATSPSEVATRLGPDLRRDLVPVGQESAFAADLARRFGTVGGVLQGFATAIDTHLDDVRRTTPLAPGHGVAAVHGTAYPITQGPMTRVSDRAEFATAVAHGGGLPFLALALMSGPDVRTLLERTAEMIGDRPWGVGILGFVPPEIRAEQLEVVHDVRPPFALIAGGRPSQAQPLEDVGISTYLHVPSPGLLDRFLAEGARKFVFEGRECGGHVGPRSSFTLWDAQLERLSLLDDPENLQILLAGGIHDDRSAAMAATAAAPLVARGASLGVLMGTAYLFTAEVVSTGAIQPAFQEISVACERTVLLETSPGHATRCVETNYVKAFRDRERQLVADDVDVKSRWAELETLNLGRLRIASKGLIRTGDILETVDDATQRRDGMYMIGEVATLQTKVSDIAHLHRNVSEGSAAFLAEDPTPTRLRTDHSERIPEPYDIAIVGMEAFLPGAVGADQFWAEILSGKSAITEVPPSRWDTSLYYDADSFTRGAGRKTPSKWGGFLDAIGFDPLQYGIPPTSLSAIEPVQLLSLEVAARALADAGYETRAFDRSRASVIFGAESGNELGGAYGARAFLPQVFGAVPDELESYLPALTEDSFPGVLTNVIAGRIANRLDLGGVNFTVDAACASSLTAVDAGCKELRSGVSDLVICGGADLHNGLNDFLMFASVHALSPTGQCRTFDATADGIALGEGIACVVLKRRVDAERDGDRIYAIIDAVAGSSDGRSLGLTAPRKEGQQRAVVRAWAQAGHGATSLGLVEAHGTGTVVGDRTELATLTELFIERGADVGKTALGSVKSQIGHTKCAAGLAGLIKAAKAVHHGVLPPTRNITTPTAYYDATTSPFRFLDRPAPWPQLVRRAGVSAFGFGGTNFHMVISSHPDDAIPRHGLERWPAELFVLRAASDEALATRLDDLLELVGELRATDPGEQRHRFRDLAAGVAVAGTGPVRAAIVADDLGDLETGLRIAADGHSDSRAGVFVTSANADPGLVGFLYPGQGSQRPNMLSDLFVAFPWLGDILRSGDQWAEQLLPAPAYSPEERSTQQAAITATEVAQPTLGMASTAMTRVLGHFGSTPDAAGGHSYGELAALAAAGTMDLATLLDISAARGEAIVAAIAESGGDAGTMAAVELSREALAERMEAWPDLVLANHNGPTQTVISGPTESVIAAVEELKSGGIRAKQLPVACAFHSPIVQMAGKLFAERLQGARLATPAIPVWSNVTAERYPDATDGTTVAQLLADQVVSGVRFVDQIESMYAAGVRTFVEVGPGRVLTQQVGRILGDRPHAMIATDVSGEHGIRRLLLAVAELATQGVDVDVEALFDGRAEAADLRAWPMARPGWTIDGAFVRNAGGLPVANSLQPADEMPALALSTGGAATSVGGSADQVVLDYLHNVRQLVAAERDVMLGYLGAAPSGIGQFDQARAGAITSTAIDRGGSIDAPGGAVVSALDVSPAAQELRGDALLTVVLEIVSDRTGYPIEMLDPDLDLEADLSIDSIKRIEIIGELAGRVGLAGVDEATVDEDMVEELAQLKSLRGIVEWIDEHAPAAAATGGQAIPAATARPELRGDALLSVVLEIVSDRTGYPIEMLDPDLDLEADLSIDSIKRIEIIGELAGRVGLAGVDEATVDEDMVEELAQLKSLRGIVEWIDSTGTSTGADTAVDARAEASPQIDVPDGALRFTTSQVALDPPVATASLDGTKAVVLGGDGPLRDALLAALGSHGADVSGAISPDDAQLVVDLGGTERSTTEDAREVFARIKPALLGAAETVMIVTSTEGCTPATHGAHGLARALAREFVDKKVRSVEFGPSEHHEPEARAQRIVDELCDVQAPETVTWRGEERLTRRISEPIDVTGKADQVLDGSSVVVVTGGARGITARVATRLAAETGCHLVLVGRSPLPDPEDPRLVGATDRNSLRRKLLELGELRTPAEIEQALNRVLADREIRATIATVEAEPGTMEYHAADVRSAEFATLLGEVRSRLGRIDGFIHGAGVLDDHFVRDKTADGFDRVFGTKVEGARAVLAARDDTTRFTVLFASVSGVFGNRGQCDYAAANDALDALAHRASSQGLGRVVSVDWGPWGGGGMVSPELEREYERRGIGLLDPNHGVDAMYAEIIRSSGPAQIIVMRGTPEAFAPASARQSPSSRA